jgi:Ca-activated chloride channel family protein
MEWARPGILYLLLIVPLLGAYMLHSRRRRQRELEAFAGKLSESLAPGRSWRRGLAKSACTLGALASIIVAAAGPRFGSKLVKVEREGVDLVLALDTSLSMLAEDMKPNRLERAKMEIIDLIRGLKGDRVGIVVFAGDAFTLCPLTVDYDAALMLAGAIDVNMVSEPGTAIGKAITQSVALFENSRRKDKAVILVTDGESLEGDPVQAAKEAAEKGVKIYAIGIGNPSGELIPLRGTDGSVEGYKKDKSGETVMTKLDEVTLQRVAEAGGGKYVPATQEGIELKVIYNEIEGMEKKKIKGEFMEKKEERFAWFLGAAFAMLLAEMLISSRGSRGSGRGRILHTGAKVALLVLLLSAHASWARGVDGSKVEAGNKYFEAGAYDKALALYRDAVGDSTKPPKHYHGVYYNEANALAKMGKYAEALGLYQESYDAGDSLLAGRVLYNRGNTLMKMGKASEAVASYVQALNFLADDPDVIHNLEVALKRMKEEQKRKQQQDKQEQDRKQRSDERKKGGEGKKQQDQQGNSEQEQKRNGEKKNESGQKKGEKREAKSDSTSAFNPSKLDSTRTPKGEPKPGKFEKLSREDALRILQALAEQERNLQREKKRAAFKKIRKSGKDW